jgi:peptidoglycan/LPS O-acetylase OafA/YrhL
LKRIFGLDLLRAVSIWLVLLQHTGITLFGLTGQVQIGSIGVDIFFVLSGFLIGSILLRDLSTENSLRSIRKFLIRRWFRILPVYYLCLFFKFCFIDHSIGANILYYVFFLQNNFYGIKFYGVTWSLVIEEWFYLFTPFFFFMAIRLLKSHGKILLVLILFIASESLLRYAYVSLRSVPYSGVNSSFPFRFDSLFLGVLLAYLKLHYAYLYNKLAQWRFFLLGCISFTGYLFYLSSISIPEIRIDQLLFPRTLGFLWLDLSIALLIPYINRLKTVPGHGFVSRITGGFITQTSILTYSIYLTHMLVTPYTFSGSLPFSGWAGHFLLTIAATYLISYLLYHFYEKPMLDLRERFR